MFLIRVTHSSGMLEGKYTAETKFPPTDHRSHRPRSWLLNGVKKVEQLRFLENAERTLGQAALQWLLADDRVASTLPNIYNEEQLVEFAKAPDTAPLTSDDMAKIEELYSGQFRHRRRTAKVQGDHGAAERNCGGVVRGAHAARVLVAASRRNELQALDLRKKSAMASRHRQHARPRALPGINLIRLVPRPVRHGGFRVVPDRAAANGRRSSDLCTRL